MLKITWFIITQRAVKFLETRKLYHEKIFLHLWPNLWLKIQKGNDCNLEFNKFDIWKIGTQWPSKWSSGDWFKSLMWVWHSMAYNIFPEFGTCRIKLIHDVANILALLWLNQKGGNHYSFIKKTLILWECLFSEKYSNSPRIVINWCMSQDIFWVFYVQVWWKISKGSDPNCQWQIPVHYIIRWLCVNLNHLSPTNSRLPLLYSTIPRPLPHLKSPNLSPYPPPTSTWHVGSTMCANFLFWWIMH